MAEINNGIINEDFNIILDFQETEINENIELEYEIKVPKFLCDYINSEMNKNFVLLEGSYQNIVEEADNHLLFLLEY